MSAARERRTCPDCGRKYLAPVGVRRAHGCTVTADLAAIHSSLAERRSFLIVLLWWANRKAARP